MEDRPALAQVLAELVRVDQVAIVSDRQAAARVLHHKGLGILELAYTGGRVAHLSDRQTPWNLGEGFGGENLGPQPHLPMGMVAFSIPGYDTRRPLAAILQ